MKTLIIIPSRLSATRLPGKPLLKINDISIISHVFNKAKETNIGEVIVAAEDQEIVNDVKKNGGKAILTSNKHKTGTDRIYEAYQKLNLDNIDFIMNLQGDEPAINIKDILNLNQMMIDHKAKIGTLAAKIENKIDLTNENIVKVITENNLEDVINRIKGTQGEFVLYAMTASSFESLALNFEEIKRFIEEQNQIILYYEKAVTPREDNTENEDTIPDVVQSE